MDYPSTLPEWVQPGVSFRLNYGPGNPNNTRMHVRGIVDDRAVLREWWPRKQRWNYVVEGPVFFFVAREHIVRDGK